MGQIAAALGVALTLLGLADCTLYSQYNDVSAVTHRVPPQPVTPKTDAPHAAVPASGSASNLTAASDAAETPPIHPCPHGQVEYHGMCLPGKGSAAGSTVRGENSNTGNISGGSVPNRAPSGGNTSARGAYLVQKVYFGTDRQPLGAAANVTFGVKRADHLTYGEVDVSIPRDHRRGALESPSVWLLQFHEDPEKHITVLRTATLAGDAFWSSVRRDIEASSSRSLLLFIHGFDVGFADAARRTAQMAYDLGFGGAPVFFSWPSQGRLSPLAYAADEQAIIDAQPHLEQFLREILTQSGAGNVYLVAHSMGNRALTHVLASLAAGNPDAVRRIREVILAAPDIGTTEFTEQIAPALLRLGAPVTLYASSRDNALAASEQWHNGARLGESGPHLVVLDGIETIDATDAGDDLLGHSYVGERTVLDDMFYLISADMRAGRRCCLRASSLQGHQYWVFMK